MHITPEILEASYELLKLTPPFNRWKLPDADDVIFHATPGPNRYQGEHWFDEKNHNIRVNPKRHSTMWSMLATLAHEMIHVRESQLSLRADVFHGRTFQALATKVCKVHGFDRGQF